MFGDFANWDASLFASVCQKHAVVSCYLYYR